jgi:hypothetical protein
VSKLLSPLISNNYLDENKQISRRSVRILEGAPPLLGIPEFNTE